MDRNIAEDTDRSKRSECKDGETKIFEGYSCTCNGGFWLCPWDYAKDTDRSKRSECSADDFKMIECNECCWENGHWLCTVRDCEKGSDRTGIARR